MQDLVKELSDQLRIHNTKLVTAESCTGGMLAAAITELPGSSDVFDRGFVTYSNTSKADELEVPMQRIQTFGAVSPEVARSMAAGALKNSQADLALSITGIAGPDGGSEDKPVGTVFIGYSRKGGKTGAEEFHFEGDRGSVRTKSCESALEIAIKILKGMDNE